MADILIDWLPYLPEWRIPRKALLINLVSALFRHLDWLITLPTRMEDTQKSIADQPCVSTVPTSWLIDYIIYQNGGYPEKHCLSTLCQHCSNILIDWLPYLPEWRIPRKALLINLVSALFRHLDWLITLSTRMEDTQKSIADQPCVSTVPTSWLIDYIIYQNGGYPEKHCWSTLCQHCSDILIDWLPYLPEWRIPRKALLINLVSALFRHLDWLITLSTRMEDTQKSIADQPCVSTVPISWLIDYIIYQNGGYPEKHCLSTLCQHCSVNTRPSEEYMRQ